MVAFINIGRPLRRLAASRNKSVCKRFATILRPLCVDGNPAMQKIQQDFVPRVKGIQPHPQILKILQSVWPVAKRLIAAILAVRKPLTRCAKLLIR